MYIAKRFKNNSILRIVTNYTPQEENYLTTREYRVKLELATSILMNTMKKKRKMLHKIICGV